MQSWWPTHAGLWINELRLIRVLETLFLIWAFFSTTTQLLYLNEKKTWKPLVELLEMPTSKELHRSQTLHLFHFKFPWRDLLRMNIPDRKKWSESCLKMEFLCLRVHSKQQNFKPCKQKKNSLKSLFTLNTMKHSETLHANTYTNLICF